MTNLNQTAPKVVKIKTHWAARILGVHFTTIHKYRRNGKIKSAVRASNAPHGPWEYDRSEIEGLKHG